MSQSKKDPSIWFFAYREGEVNSFSNVPTASSMVRALTIKPKIVLDGETGLTGIAVHPNYPDDNRIFILYNDGTNQQRSTLSSYRVNTATRIVSGAEQVLLTLNQPTAFHNGGDIQFGPDGMLYASFGESQASEQAQNNSNLYGTIIRIDVDKGTPYTIPTDNPFNTGQTLCATGQRASGNCPEIFAYGFRNPWRFSFDRDTGEMWVGDVGQDTWEEVDRVIPGGNYGWPIMEAHVCYEPRANCNQAGLQLPFTYYRNSGGGDAIAGGFVYRGDNVPELFGKYVFADIATGDVYAIATNKTPLSTPELLFRGAGRTIVSFGQDSEGEIYGLHGGGAGQQFLRLAGETRRVNMPNLLSQTGCFNVGPKTAPTGVVHYELNSTLWSDGEDKERYFAIPNSTMITVNPDKDFIFGQGSVLVKNFIYNNAYIETRLFMHHDLGWRGYSYEWNKDQSDAVLLTDGKTVDLGDINHSFPSRNDCFSCHTSAANVVLGPEVRQFNKVHSRRGSNQLSELSAMGFFNAAVNPTQEQALAAINDTSKSVEARARSYLHSNCSGCHRPNAPGQVMDLRFTTSLVDTGACNIEPRDNLGVTNARLITPGNPDASVLVMRMKATDDNRMPPLATEIVDAEAVKVVSDWIQALSRCD